MSLDNERLTFLLKELEIGENSKMIADFDRKEFFKNLKKRNIKRRKL
ncbi:hypothetical protein [Flavobacterium zepuense]|nr:hypothetical protein [Flavobacterium zepuense]